MLMHMRARTGWRHTLVVLALLAVALKFLVPAGFMPGTSLAAPIVLCPGQGPMMAMDHGGHHEPAKAPDKGADHSCAFAGLGLATFAAPLGGSELAPIAVATIAAATSSWAVAPGLGLAAPPPPSHAPPAFRT